jgi:glycosyltransferase involved in cell wall biosynthesis
MKVSVIVRARNEANFLPRLIEGLNAQDLIAEEFILVDSGSTDSTVDIALGAGWSVVHIATEDFTFGRSLNVGCSQASGDILVMLSAHVYPLRKDFLRNLVASVSPSKRSVSYGRQVGNEQTHFSEKMLMEQWFPAERVTDQGHAFTNNANSCVSRTLWEEFKYDELITGLEDIDFSLRVMRSGGQVNYVGDAPVVHVHVQTYRQIRERYRREAIAYRQIFAGETLTALRALVLFAKNIVRDTQAAKTQKMLLPQLLPIIAFRFSQFFGAWSGFRDSLSNGSALLRKMYYPGSRYSAIPNLGFVESDLLIRYGNQNNGK